MEYVIALTLVALGGLFLLSRKDSYQAGEASKEIEILNEQNAKMASRPLTDDDLVKRLQSLAANKPDDKPIEK